jgi:cytochrome c553
MMVLKLFKYGVALAGLAILVSLSLHAQQRQEAPLIVVRTCSGCHEIDGLSQLPYIPRVAGLSAVYSERKLASFQAAPAWPVDEAVRWILHTGGRDPGFTRPAVANMVGIAHAVSETELKSAIQWYASQTPAAGRSPKSKLFEPGRSIFTNGFESQGLIACQACHGAGAQGNDKAPRLAGQNAEYVVNQLALFRKADPKCAPEMAAVAKNLQLDQARAVAVYLQSR